MHTIVQQAHEHVGERQIVMGDPVAFTTVPLCVVFWDEMDIMGYCFKRIFVEWVLSLKESLCFSRSACRMEEQNS